MSEIEKPLNYKKRLQNYRSREDLIPILRMVQSENGYIPESIIEEIALKSSLSLADIYGVITFYKQFRLDKPGKHTIRVCNGTACHVNSSQLILDAIEEKLGIKVGETDKKKNFTLTTVSCLGCCSLAPSMMIDMKVYGNLTGNRAVEILDEILASDTGA